ncbi:MAG: DedA family protein [Candidatus Pacearchaeota archaeon]|jgi:membrane protein DedA with SNARE-associated domain
MVLVEFMLTFVTGLIASLGYFGLVLLMALESMIFPLPSELVMPFAGFLIYQGDFNLFSVIIFSTIGTIIGSLLSYYIGYYLGEPFFEKYGKWFLLNKHDLDLTKRFFQRYGDKTIFISRFIPVVRHLISIPAGVGKMNIWKFTFYTALGGAMWNTFLAYLGIKLGENWELVSKYSQMLDIVVIIILAGLVIWFVRRHLKNREH